MLTFDARGHGESGGLVGIDGPREVADTRAVPRWLAARPDVSDTRIGAWGISYGGGAVFNSLVAGVPWAAVVTVETWTDLYSALMPQGLAKSGVVVGLACSIPEAEARSLAGRGAGGGVRREHALPCARGRRSARACRSSARSRRRSSWPRAARDFLFGIDQGSLAFQRLRGPKVLYVGLHGHAPSTFPAADTGVPHGPDARLVRLLPPRRAWLPGCRRRRDRAGEASRGRRRATRSLPPVSPTIVAFPGVTTFARSGKAVRTGPAAAEGDRDLRLTDGADLPVAASGGWSRLVAVLTARTPQGQGDRRQRGRRPDEERRAQRSRSGCSTRRRSSRGARGCR